MWDLRTQSGWLVAILGAILIFVGVFAPGYRDQLTDVNAHLYTGIPALVFGGS